MYEDTGGVAVVFGGVTTSGHRDVAHPSVGERLQVSATVYRVSFAAGVLSGVKVGVTLEVGGENYRVKSAVDDGYDAGVDEAWYLVKL